MRVGIFTDTYLPDINGVVSSVVLLKDKLEEHGHQVWIITNHKGSKIIQEGNVIRLPGIEIKKLYGYKLTQPIHLLYIEEIKSLKFDIIHVQQEFGVGIYGKIVANSLNIPLVRTYHTAYEDYVSYFNPVKSERIDNVARNAIENISKIIGDDCLRLIAPSIKTKEMLEGYGIKTPITVIPTGLILDEFNPNNFSQEQLKNIRKEIGINDDEKMFVYVGRIGSEKNIDILIKGFKKVKENNLNAKLVIIGSGPYLNVLKELSNSLDLNSHVLFLGKKDHKDVPLYYNAGDCFVSASVTETQGMTYIEALASGLPLICKKDNVLLDVLKEGYNGYFFENEDDFYLRVKEFVNCDKQSIFFNNALETSKKYDADLFAYNIANVYEEVIEEFVKDFTITKVQLKEDIVVINIESTDLKEKISISSDTYLELGLRKGDRLSKQIYERIKREEVVTLAYRKTLKKIAVRDYSEREIRDYLYANFDISQNQIDDLINKLKEYSFIDDEKYVFNKINSFKNLLYSKRMMIKKLKEAGISQEIIDKNVTTTFDEELIKAKKLSNKYNLAIHGKSLNSRKQTIIKKLVDNGYSLDIAKNAIEYLDFSAYKLEESEVLKIEANKALRKYSKKYEGRELRNRLFNYLASKGFELDKIYAIINEME